MVQWVIVVQWRILNCIDTDCWHKVEIFVVQCIIKLKVEMARKQVSSARNFMVDTLLI
jgi:hypothetical protein